MVDAQVLEKLESGFKKLKESDSKSLLKKHLTQEIFDQLKVKKTPTFGSTLLDVIQSGLENHDSGVGIYAPDAEAYTVFADLFDPIIEDYHGGFKKTDKHPPKNWGDVSVFGNLDPAGEFIVSTRVRCGRSMEGYPFNPCLTEEQYKEMEQKVSSTLSGLEGELKGTFYPLTGMSKEVQQKLIDDHFLFKEGDRFLQAANACRFWPSGRGIFHNDAKTFLVWCNEEDHLRIISMQMGGDLGTVYRRLVTAVNDIEKRIPFSHNDRLGFLTFCPTNLGTTVRASVHIKVPKLAANKAKLEEIAGKYNLQIAFTMGIIFGKKKKTSRVTEQDKAILQLKQQRDKLKQYQKRIELSLSKDRDIAKKLLSGGQKDRAKLLLRKKRYQEQLLTKTDNQLDNLEKLTHEIEFAQVELQVVEGLKVGNDALKKVNDALNIEDIESILEETREGIEKQNEINELLSGKLTDEDEAAVEEELAAIITEQLPEVPSEDPVPQVEKEESAKDSRKEKKTKDKDSVAVMA